MICFLSNGVLGLRLVTGAGSGIGKACSLALAKAGFCVVLAGRRADLLCAVEDTISQVGGVGMALPTDITDETAVIQCFEAARERFGRIDLLFNNAGTQIAGNARSTKSAWSNGGTLSTLT